jgi:4-hydroxybenzoate polyprenyltransferase
MTIGADTPSTKAPAPLPTPLRAALADIKLAHSIFALPFAILAAFLVAPRAPDSARILWPTFAGQLALIILCMVLARTWAMLINRLADHRFDAANPRTARRAIPAGRLSTRHGWALALSTAALFWAAASLFGLFFHNWWPAILAVPVLAWIALYSYTKRFTALCHLFLGAALAASPIAAAIAVNPDTIITADAPPVRATILLLAAFVMLWVAGFDIAYALQDLDFDRRTGLRSIPARLGLRGALWTSRTLHAAAFLILCLAVHRSGLGPALIAAAALVGALLIFEHITLARRGIAGLPMAFFTLNGIISLTLAAAGITDILMA